MKNPKISELIERLEQSTQYAEDSYDRLKDELCSNIRYYTIQIMNGEVDEVTKDNKALALKQLLNLINTSNKIVNTFSKLTTKTYPALRTALYKLMPIGKEVEKDTSLETVHMPDIVDNLAKELSYAEDELLNLQNEVDEIDYYVERAKSLEGVTIDTKMDALNDTNDLIDLSNSCASQRASAIDPLSGDFVMLRNKIDGIPDSDSNS